MQVGSVCKYATILVLTGCTHSVTPLNFQRLEPMSIASSEFSGAALGRDSSNLERTLAAVLEEEVRGLGKFQVASSAAEARTKARATFLESSSGGLTAPAAGSRSQCAVRVDLLDSYGAVIWSESREVVPCAAGTTPQVADIRSAIAMIVRKM